MDLSRSPHPPTHRTPRGPFAKLMALSTVLAAALLGVSWSLGGGVHWLPPFGFVLGAGAVAVFLLRHWSAPFLGHANALTLGRLALVALLLISVCATRGYRAWRRVERDGTGIEARQRARFLGLLMFVLSLLAIVGTVMIAIPMLLLDPCAA